MSVNVKVWLQLTTSSAKSILKVKVNSLVASGNKIGFKYFADNYAGVFIADKIGLKCVL